MPAWARVTVAIAIVRVGAALSVYVSGLFPSPDPRAIPLWMFAVLASLFTLVGLGLVVGHQNDRRAAWLGGILSLIGCPLTTPLIAGSAGGPLWWLVHLRPEAFLSSFVWDFLICFPTEMRGRAAHIAKGLAGAAAAVGAFLAAASLVALSDASSALMQALRAVPIKPSVFFWPLLLATSIPAFFTLLVRARTGDSEVRRRIQLFVAALLLGLLPFTIEVLIEGLWPWYWAFAHSPAVEPWLGAVLFGTLGTVPFTTAYSVLFDRVVSVRIVLHKALQYALARYTIVAATLVPFAGLALFVAAHRHEPIVALVSEGWRPFVLLSLVAAGGLTLRLRARLLASLDRRYFREPYDGRRILERLMDSSAAGGRELAQRVAHEIAAAFHAAVDVFVLDGTSSTLQHTEARVAPLSAMTPLVQGGDDLIDLDSDQRQETLQRLPPHEREWLAHGGYRLIVPIRSQPNGVKGLIALTSKLSELPYSADDRRFLAAIASAAGMALDAGSRRAPMNRSGEPAACSCPQCFTIYATDAKHCVCGRVLIPARVPHVLRGVFRFEQQIARGATGAVYRAVDLSLGRYVAMKALSSVSEDGVQALMQEARAMARVTHVNLAAVYGVEQWNDTAFLAQEYLEHGTLAERLSRSSVDVLSAVDLGITLSAVLEHMHRADLIHCDIKPSNIGYTSDDVVKLFDFGLARTRQLAPGNLPAASIIGTPLYMSPEAIQGETPTPRFDLWGLSVVLYEAIAGRRPFDGATTPDVLAAILQGRPPHPLSAFGVDAGVSRFFEAALHRDSARRPGSAAEFRHALFHLRSSLRPTELARSVSLSDPQGT